MGVTTRYSPYAVQVGATLIGGIQNQNVNTGAEVVGQHSDGQIYITTQHTTAVKPSGGFTTLAIAKALGAIGLTGVAIASGATLAHYLQNHVAGGTRGVGSTQIKYLVNKGIIVPRSLSCQHQQNATISYQWRAIYDGTNESVVKSVSQSLPAGLVDNERFTLGPITVAGFSLGGKTSLEIDFGVTDESLGSDSDVEDTFCSINQVQPTITIRGIDPSWFDSAESSGIGLNGAVGTHVNTTIALRKRLTAGSFVPDLTAQHVEFTCACLAIVPDLISDDPAGNTIILTPEYDGTNAPIVIDTTATL